MSGEPTSNKMEGDGEKEEVDQNQPSEAAEDDNAQIVNVVSLPNDTQETPDSGGAGEAETSEAELEQEEHGTEASSGVEERDLVRENSVGEVLVPKQSEADSFEETSGDDEDESPVRADSQEETPSDKDDLQDIPIANVNDPSESETLGETQDDTDPKPEAEQKLTKKEQMRARLAAKKKAKEKAQQAEQASAAQESSALSDTASQDEPVDKPMLNTPKPRKSRSGRVSPRVKELPVECNTPMQNPSYFDTADFIDSVAIYDRGLRHLYDRYRCAQVVTGRFVTFSEISSKWSLINFNELFRLCKDFGIVHSEGLGRQELKRIFIVCTDPKGNMQALTFEQFRKFLSLCADELLNTDRWRDKYSTVQARVNALFFHMGLSEDKKNERNKRMRAFGGFMYGDGMLGGHDEVSLDRAGKSPFQGHDYTKGSASTDNILASIECHEAEQEGEADLHPLGAPLRSDKRIHNPFALSTAEEQDLLEKCGLAEPEESKEEAKRKAHWDSIDSLNVADLFSFKPLPRQKQKPMPIPMSPEASPLASAPVELATAITTATAIPHGKTDKATKVRVASPCNGIRPMPAQALTTRRSGEGTRKSEHASAKRTVGKKLQTGEVSRSRKFLNKLQQAKARRTNGVAIQSANRSPPPKRGPPARTRSTGRKSSPKPPARKHLGARSTRREPTRRLPSHSGRSLSPTRKQTYARTGRKPQASQSTMPARPAAQPAVPGQHRPQAYQPLVSQPPSIYAPPRGVEVGVGVPGIPGISGIMPGAPYVPFYTAMPYGTMPMPQPYLYPPQVSGHYGWVAQGSQQPSNAHHVSHQLPSQ